MEGYDSGGLSDALITTRDGIIGSWSEPGVQPDHHDAEMAANLEMWEPRVRAAVIDFDLHSKLAFTDLAAASAADAARRQVSIWHVNAPAGHPPTGTHLPLARFDRPPADVFLAQLGFLQSYAELRPDRAVEILEQLATPVPFLASVAFLRPDSKPWTMELIDALLRFARLVEYRVKHALACRRPNEFSPQVQPMILTPGHGTLPSGHATEAFATALFLWRFLRATGITPYLHASYGVQFMRLAARIAINRTVAGVHFPVDSVAGMVLGLTLGNYFFARAQPGAVARTYRSAHFDGSEAGVGAEDFIWTASVDLTPAAPGVKFAGDHPAIKSFGPNADGSGSNAIAITGDRSQTLEWLWTKARAEWR